MKVWGITLAISLTIVACGGAKNGAATATASKFTSSLTEAALPATSLPAGETFDGNAPGIPVLKGEIKTTPNGLRYIDEKIGDGASPAAGSRVIVNYSGWFPDGSIFDSSVARGHPETLDFNALLKGWQEGLSTMKVGGKRRLILPPALAYGALGQPPVIPPNATVAFDIELLAVQ